MVEDKDKQDETKSEDKRTITIKLPKISKLNPWMITTFVLLAVSLVLLVQPQITGQFTVIGGMNEKEAANKAVEWISSYYKSRGTDVTMTLVDAKRTENDIIEFTIKVSGEDDMQKLYVTKDGKLFLPQAISTVELVTTTTTQPEQIPKSDRPKVDLYVMSFCPYGNEAENTMFPVYNLLKDKVDWNIHYIVSVSGGSIISLHGQKEVDQNEREACVLKEYGLDKWWPFVTYVNENCGSDGSCWKDSAKEAGLDADKIETCVEEEGLDLMKKEAEAATSAGVTGSPTLMINGIMSRAVYQYGNSEAYKQAICPAFNSLPKECEQILSSSGSSAGGQC